MKMRDFSNKSRFPGETGNLLDIILHKAMLLERIPSPLFFALLIILCFAGYPNNGIISIALIFFFLFDWISISLLPRFKRSYGPAKPQVLSLAMLRILPVLIFPFSVWLPLQVVGCLLQIYGFWIEPFQLKVVTQEIQSDKLPESFTLKLLHIGDLHLEHQSIREKKLNNIIQTIAPEIILFSGDFLNLSFIRNQKAWSELREVLSGWNAPWGIFCVTGSPAVDLPENFPHLLTGTLLKLLEDESVYIEKNGTHFEIIGLRCTHKPHMDAPKLLNIIGKEHPHFRILLYHSPDIVPSIPRDSIDLHLAGHTHGGQICLPIIGPLFTGSLYGLKFKSGRYNLHNLVLYITRGLGLEGLSAPRVRFLCPPEVVVWNIIGSERKDTNKWKRLSPLLQ